MSDRETKRIHALVSETIISFLGDISALPQAVQSKVQSVYHAFFTAYLGICRLKRPRMTVETEIVNDLDPEVLDCMQHCFSDYQHLFRQFEVLNPRVRALLPIDGERYPLEFQASVDDLLSDRPVFPSESILEEILETTQSNRGRFPRGKVLEVNDSPWKCDSHPVTDQEEGGNDGLRF
jgi:hypothetical protein